MKRSIVLTAAAAACTWIAAAPVLGQAYHNVSNARFRSISNGPQSAFIVDVADTRDAGGVEAAVRAQWQARIQARHDALAREVALLRARGAVRRRDLPVVVDTAIVRSGGRLMLPEPATGRVLNDLTFTYQLSGTNFNIPAMVNVIYPLLRDSILGRPGWSGNVLIKTADPLFGTNGEDIGALLAINGSTVEIDMPNFSDPLSQYLAIAQSIAQAFHAPMRIAYDAWEQGMGRAAATVAAFMAPSSLQLGEPLNSFFYTPVYDLLNQPALGNSTFTPPTPTNATFDPTSLQGMLLPRLQMSGTAWLKCYIENTTFFSSFNAAYYSQWAADHSIANDVSRLRLIAAGVQSTIEGQSFDTWFDQQYVLDTSVTQGRKLYIWTEPLPPTSSSSGDDGAAFVGVYYTTTASGDETNNDGTGQVIYWDYAFQNRLSLPSFETIAIQNGIGTVSPFFTNIGGNPADQMRVTADFPVNREYARVPYPAGELGTQTSPNDVAGVLIGASAGSLTVRFDGGSGSLGPLNMAQGSFGFAGASGTIPKGFSRTHLTYTSTGNPTLTFIRNTATFGSGEAAGAHIFVLPVPAATTALSHTIPSGAQMVTLPLQPLQPDLAKVLNVTPSTLLLAQYRQDLPGPDRYLRYPNNGAYQPGTAFWTNLANPDAITNLVAGDTSIQQDISVPLEFGWNQVGDPYTTPININQSVTFQYLGGDVVSLSEAITRGWVAAGVLGFSSASGYYDITTNPPTGIPLNILDAWKGYWIRVLVTEGVTITYANPTRAAVLRTRAAAAPPRDNGWQVPIIVRDEAGGEARATLGASSRGSDRFTPSLDVASPPLFPGAGGMAVRFAHPDWDNGNPGGFLSDIRGPGLGAEWTVDVTVPRPGGSYTLGWANTALLPHGVRLTVQDSVAGTRQTMSAGALHFTMGPAERTRRFIVRSEARGGAILRVADVEARSVAPPGRGIVAMQITWSQSAAADTVLEIRSGGRVVRRLQPGRLAVAGPNSAIWDGRDDVGRSLGNGVYLLTVTAHDSDGNVSRYSIPLVVPR